MPVPFELIRTAILVIAALLLPFWLVRSGIRWLLQHWADRARKGWGWLASLANAALACALVREWLRLDDPFWLACALVPGLVGGLGLWRLLKSGQPPPWGPSSPSLNGRAAKSYPSISISFDD